MVQSFLWTLPDSLPTLFLLVVAVGSFQPIKSIPFALPYLLLAGYAVLARRYREVEMTSRRVFTRVSIALLLWLSHTLAQSLFQPRFSFSAALLSLLTYGPILFLIATPWKALEQTPDGRRIFFRMAGWILIIQSCIGIGQGLWNYSRTGTFLGSTGDAVEGTIHLALNPSGSFANPMFAANIAFLLIAVVPHALLRRPSRFQLIAIALGCIAVIMSSVVHILLFLGTAIAVGAVPAIVRQRRQIRLRFASFALMAVLGAASMVGPNVLSIKVFTSMFMEGNLPRTQVLTDALWEMPRQYPHAPLAGLGSGQFSSRAGMVSAGVYAREFSTELLQAEPTDAQVNYLIRPYLRSLQGHPLGSTGQPLSSWLSMFTEFGGVISFLLLGWGAVAVARRTRRHLDVRQFDAAWTLISASCLFFLMGFQENYWETAQAVMIGAVVIKSIPRLGPDAGATGAHPQAQGNQE